MLVLNMVKFTKVMCSRCAGLLKRDRFKDSRAGKLRAGNGRWDHARSELLNEPVL